MVAESTIEEVVRRLCEAAGPARIILFGSQARGDAGEQSDVDLLVVQRDVLDRHLEIVRLRDALRPLLIPFDIIVASQQQVADRGDVPGTVLHEALKEGKVLHDSL